MRFHFATALAATSLFTGILSAPTPDAIADIKAIEEGPVLEERQVGIAVNVSVYISLQTCYGGIRDHTRTINQTVTNLGPSSTWVQKNQAISTIHNELNVMANILAATTTQLASVGRNVGSDLTGIVAILLQIVFEIVYTVQNVVNQLGPGVLLILGIILNNIANLLAGLLLSVEALVHGSLSLVWNGISGVSGTSNIAVVSLIQALGFLLGLS